MSQRHIALFLPHLDVAGGLGVHVRMLLTALNSVTHPCRYTVLAPTQPRELFPTTAPERFDRSSVDSSRFAFREIDIPAAFSLASPLDPILAVPLAALRPDLVYCSYYTGLAKPPCPQFITFHDAGFLENPAGFGKTATVRLETLKAIAPSIRSIHCISSDARDRIVQLLPWDERKTRVIWHALPDSASSYQLARESKRPDGLPYFFSPVGAATGFNRSRKNLPTAVRAFRNVTHPTVRLIIAGTATLSEPVLAELLPPGERGQVVDGIWFSEDDRIEIRPTIERSDFLRMMRHAAAVVYPSRYEGFGIPTIEALALRVPLIAAKATSIPEVVGDAAVLIDPNDEAGFTVAMDDVLVNDWSQRIAKGFARLSQFQPERLGREMADWFESFGEQRV